MDRSRGYRRSGARARAKRACVRASIVALLLLRIVNLAPPTAAAPELQAPEVDISREGTVQASTSDPNFPASLAIDGDLSTSWFSTGPEPGGVPTRFQWTHARDDLITTIVLHGNGQNKNDGKNGRPDFRHNFGFGSVTVQVIDSANKVVFSHAVPLPGTPDPDVTLHPNVVGRTVLLLFSGHESKDCGGFSELQVQANRTPPSPTSVQRPPSPTTVAQNPPVIPPNPPPAPAGAVIASDDLNRGDADRCQLGALDNALGGTRTLFYLPIFPTGGTDASKPIGANIVAGALQNNGSDYGGVQFAESPTPCQGARGVNIGQDMNIRVDLLVPTDAAGHIAQAGPYIRSRTAAPGDGIIGGESAGYWVQLESTGEVKIKRLNPNAVIASSGKPGSFNAGVSHTLEIAAGGNSLQVALDGKLLTFSQDNQLRTTVSIPPTAGSNNGTAGIAFGAEANRGQIGGQRAKNIAITGYRPLNGLPTQNSSATATAPAQSVVPSAAAASTTAPTTSPRSESTTVPTVVALNPQPNPAPPTSQGDCDGDTKITEADALCALETSIQLRPVRPGSDVDNSGDVTSRDAVIILQRALGK